MATVKTLPLFTSAPAKSSGLDIDGAWEQKKRLAEMLMQGDNAPVWSAGQGLTRVAKSLMGGWMAREAQSDRDREENATLSAMREAVTGTTGLGDAPAPITTDEGGGEPSSFDGSSSRRGGSGGASRAAAANERARRAHARLVEKGYSEHAAAGIVANAMKESSMNTGAVGDNGTAFGLFQHRGPRFENLKKFAASQGKDWRDFDTNLDFADHEMRNGLDRGAAVAFKKLQTAKTAEEASDIFMNYFERPSKAAAASSGPKRRAFAASLIKQGVSPAAATAIASGEAPGAPEAAYAAGEGRRAAAMPEMPDLPPPDLSAARSKMQRGQRLMQTRGTFQAGLQLYQQGEAEAQALQQEYQKARRNLGVEVYKQRREEALKREGWDREDDREERKRLDPAPTNDQRDFEYGEANPKFREYEREKRGGMTITYDAQNRPVITTGGAKAGGNPTEMNQKYEQFYMRGSGANAILDETDEALAKAETYIREYGPQAAQDYLLSDEYKVARQAADDFLITIIRPDTGAAVTDTEFRIYGNIFLPRPNDPPAVLAQKRDSRARALEALKAGMKPEQVLRQAAPDKFDGKSIVPKDLKKQGKSLADVQKGEEVDGYIYLGGDKTKPESWRKK